MIKGIARIELYENGKKVHEQVEENMVTNALKNLISPDFRFSYLHTDNIIQKILTKGTPLYKTALGGVLLFDSHIPENPNQIFAPKGVYEVGHAGGPYAGTQTNKGTYNENESGTIEGGYRHVWDFTTDKANGTIRCVSLTSISGGNAGRGTIVPTSAVDGRSINAPCDFGVVNAHSADSSGLIHSYTDKGGAFICNIEPGINVHAYSLDGKFYFSKKRKTTTFNVMDTIALNLQEKYNVMTAVTPDLRIADAPITPNVSCSNLNEDNQLVFISRAGTTFGSTNVLVTIINPITFEVISNRIVTLTKSIGTTNFWGNICFNNKLYLQTSSTSVSVFSMNGEWLKNIDTARPFGISDVYSTAPTQINDKILFGNGASSLNNDVVEYGVGASNSSYGKVLSGVDIKAPYVYILPNHTSTEGNFESSLKIGILTTYLATINNLASPIEKSSAQTMKIVYDILTE